MVLHLLLLTGGSDQVVYRSRWQKRATSDDGWINTAFQNHDNEATEFVYGIPTSEAGWQIRLQTQARDEADDPVTQVKETVVSKILKSVSSVHLQLLLMTSNTTTKLLQL